MVEADKYNALYFAEALIPASPYGTFALLRARRTHRTFALRRAHML